MSQFLALVRVQLRGLLASVGGSNTRKTRPRSAILVFALLALLAVYMSATYSFSLAAQLGPAHADLVLELMPLLGVVFTVLMGSQAAGTFVFAGRDNDLLLALPIPRLTLALGKLAALVVQNVALMLCMVLPAGLAYALQVPSSWWLWPALAVNAVLLALATTAASVILGLVITAVRNLRQGTLIVNMAGMLLLLGFVAVAVVGQMPLIEQLTTDPAPIRAWLGTWTPPLSWARDFAVDAAPLAGLLLSVATLVPFALVAWLVGRSFVALVGGATVRRGGVRKADVGAMRARSPFVALVRRESQRFFGSSVYFLNTGFGLAILLLGAGYLAVVRELPPAFAEVAGVVGVSAANLVALASAAVVATVDTTAPSVSLEGRRLWIVRGAPLPTRTILDAKVAFNVALTAPVVLVAAIAGAVATRASVADALLLLALPLVVSVVVAQLGLIANLTWTNLDAPNDTLVVKQSAAVLATLFGGFAVVILAAVAGLSLARPLGSGTVAFWIVTALLVGLAAGERALLRTWGVRAFAALV